MPYFKAKMHEIRFRLGLCPRSRSIGELTALPQTSLLNLRGPTLKRREGEKGSGKGKG